MPEKEFLIGRKFSSLTVIEEAPKRNQSRRIIYKCKCDCGNIKLVDVSGLRRGHTTSCGCLRKSNQTSFERMCKRIYKGYRVDAVRRNVDFNLSRFDFDVLIQQECFYCGRLPNNTFYDVVNKVNLKYSGIDRYDNSIGYYLYNCVPCCIICNKAKRNLSSKEFFDWLNDIFEHNIGKDYLDGKA
jgi:hypothetical protein